MFGVFLAQYSLPLRQGLLFYSQRTLDGFLESASVSLRLPVAVGDELFSEVAAPVPAIVNELLATRSLTAQVAA